MVKIWSSWDSTISGIFLKEEDGYILDSEDVEVVELLGADLESVLQSRYPFSRFAPYIVSTITIKSQGGRKFGLITVVVKGEPVHWCLFFGVNEANGFVSFPKEGAIRRALKSIRMPAPGSCKRLI